MVDTSMPCGIFLPSSDLVEVSAGDSFNLSKKTLLRHLSSGDDYFPISMHWELLDKCNFACPFCYIVGHSKTRVVRFPEIEIHLNELIRHGLLFCTLTGGEVTLHPDFLEIYSYLRSHGVIVDVYSNGHSLREEVLSIFETFPPSAVEISIYSLRDDILANEYRVQGTDPARRVLANILRLKAAGVNVVCKTFENAMTANEIPEIIDWCTQSGVRHYSSSNFTEAYDGADLSAFSLGKLTDSSQGANVIALPCGTRNYGCALDSAFRMSPCPSIRLPEASFDVRKLGVDSAIDQMKEFINWVKDQEISPSSCGTGCAKCVAFAVPVRNVEGKLYSFKQPSMVSRPVAQD